MPKGMSELNEVCPGVLIALTDGQVARRWKFDNLRTVAGFKASDFLPEGYLASLKAAGYEAEWRVRTHGASRYHIHIVAVGMRVETIAHFDIWPGKLPGGIVLEHLRLEDPLATRMDLNGGQDKKGLPMQVAFHFRKRLYGFLSAGGFTRLEVPASQNFFVGTLYRRLLGGYQSEEGAEFSRYLDRLYGWSSGFPAPYQIVDLNAFSQSIGDYFSAPDLVTRMRRITGDIFSVTPALEFKIATAGGVLFRSRDGVPIAIGLDRQLAFLYPDGDQFRLLSWMGVHKNHPTKVAVTVDLPRILTK